MEKVESHEKSEQEIVESNLQKMKRDMIDLLWTESIGGNAGSWEIEGKEYPCGGANGYFSRLNGEIVAFGNFQEQTIQDILRADTRDELERFIFRVAMDLQSGLPKKIVEIFCIGGNPITGKGDFIIEDKAKNVIDRSIEEYNKSL